MRAKFVFEKFTPDSDPIKDMGIGLTRHIQNIRRALKRMIDPYFEEEEYIEDEYIIKLDSRPIYVNPDDFYDSANLKLTWRDVGVFNPFEIIYYFSIDLIENKAERAIRILNDSIEDWEWFDRKILIDDPVSLTPEEIVKIIKEDWISYDFKYSAEEAFEEAETNYNKTQKRISTY